MCIYRFEKKKRGEGKEICYYYLKGFVHKKHLLFILCCQVGLSIHRTEKRKEIEYIMLTIINYTIKYGFIIALLYFIISLKIIRHHFINKQ